MVIIAGGHIIKLKYRLKENNPVCVSVVLIMRQSYFRVV